VSDIGAQPGSLPIEGWPLLGRLANMSAAATVFLQAAVSNGWISAKAYSDELEAARKAALWR
jgi:hypothetical protein